MLQKIPALWRLPLFSLIAGLILWPINNALREFILYYLFDILSASDNFVQMYYIYCIITNILAIGVFLLLAFFIARNMDKQEVFRSSALLSGYLLFANFFSIHIFGAWYYLYFLLTTPAIVYSQLFNAAYGIYYTADFPSVVYMVLTLFSCAMPLLFVLFAQGTKVDVSQYPSDSGKDPWEL